MDKKISFATCLLATLVLFGCAEERWQKPGATEADYETAKLSCENRALERYPVSLRQVQVQEGRVAPLATRCSGSGATLKCSTTGGQYMDPKYVPVDDNENARWHVRHKCLVDKGWKPVEEE
ncbi:MAG: hypothetical protein WC464_00890 [Bdellovibrionales bacterium]